MNQPDTIVAQATPLGYSGVSTVRLSGPLSRNILKDLSGESSLEPRRATLLRLLNKNKDTVDRAVVTFFPCPESYTGEDVIEISCHGSPAIVDEVISLACACGARIADPGEFTKRAFLNGKMDLIQAESVMSLIEAKTIESVCAQQKIISGELSERIQKLKFELVNSLSGLENEMDILEEEISSSFVDGLGVTIDSLINKVSTLIKSYKFGRYLTSGVQVVITGRPNVGKSTLLNQIVGKSRSIVSETPGTTRDIIDYEVMLCGVPVRFFDTAGIRKTKNFVENEGVVRAKKVLQSADIILNVFDEEKDISINEDDPKQVYILNKMDLRKKKTSKKSIIHISALTGEGVGLVKNHIIGSLGLHRISTDTTYISSLRQKNALDSTHLCLKKANSLIKTKNPELPLLAFELRSALDSIDTILGKTTVDDILNNIFSNFCVGK